MIKDIAIGKMKSASNYVITFLKWALISIIIGVVGGCVGALFHMSVNYANIIFTRHDWFVLFLPIGGIIIVAMYKACKMLENKIQVPEAKQAMEQFKMEAANEVGVNLKQGYNGDLQQSKPEVSAVKWLKK